MKKISLLVLLTSLLISNASMAAEEGDTLDSATAVTTLSLPLAALFYTYAPAASAVVGGAVAVSISSFYVMVDQGICKEIKILVNNDLQNFYNTGELSAMLSSSIKALKDHDSTLSDSEVLDQISTAINQ